MGCVHHWAWIQQIDQTGHLVVERYALHESASLRMLRLYYPRYHDKAFQFIVNHLGILGFISSLNKAGAIVGRVGAALQEIKLATVGSKAADGLHLLLSYSATTVM